MCPSTIYLSIINQILITPFAAWNLGPHASLDPPARLDPTSGWILTFQNKESKWIQHFLMLGWGAGGGRTENLLKSWQWKLWKRVKMSLSGRGQKRCQDREKMELCLPALWQVNGCGNSWFVGTQGDGFIAEKMVDMVGLPVEFKRSWSEVFLKNVLRKNITLSERVTTHCMTPFLCPEMANL